MKRPDQFPLAVRYGLIAVIVGGLALLFLAVASGFGQRVVTAQEFVNFQEGGNPHQGFRRAHAKGFCIAGEFIASNHVGAYTTAAVFNQRSTPFTGRISTGGGNPTAPDLASSVRSLALSFNPGTRDAWHTAMNTPPVMPVRTPEDFYAFAQVFAPDPETGQQNPERIGAFLAAHPETQAVREWQASYTPTGSFATETYNSINAFYLVDNERNKRAIRWSAKPSARAVAGSVIELTDDPNALRNEFMARLEHGPIVFDMIFTFANDSDDETDPTVLWGDDREQRLAGIIMVHRATPEADGNCDAINFDPLILPRGMAPTDDKILRARSAAYAESYRRRARENLMNARGEGSQ
ncbi:catalase family peroxidase [Aliidiomarina halalkaliphila]|uniref:Catalase-related peroxidase n=1 Tax=Aliidiomarina halalkaliphila TaxID=2593535 RepID=A0A552WZZ3_9GAMM|nr:catalase family peroxidase [Aliidiomarina halalkaliphila]TRW48390.1 catalase family peroxidase [Aliidiomarina halalkaliphila]